jgi:DNA (cytosine-5)-methyltransferase 1
VTTSLERLRITYDEFLDSLHMETDENLTTYAFLGRELSQEDVESDTVVSLNCSISQFDAKVQRS